MRSGKASVGYVFGGKKTLNALVTRCLFCKQNFNQAFNEDKWFECLSALSLETPARNGFLGYQQKAAVKVQSKGNNNCSNNLRNLERL